MKAGDLLEDTSNELRDLAKKASDETACGWCYPRPELPEDIAIHGETFPPVDVNGEVTSFYTKYNPLPYRWVREDENDEAMEVFIKKWVEAMSIDWNFI